LINDNGGLSAVASLESLSGDWVSLLNTAARILAQLETLSCQGGRCVHLGSAIAAESGLAAHHDVIASAVQHAAVGG